MAQGRMTPGSPRASRMAAAVVAVASIVACSARSGGETRFVPMPALAAPAGAIDDYDEALAAIAATFVREFGLPRVDVTLVLFPDRRAFEAGLITVGYEPRFARQTAGGFHAIGGARAVLVNAQTLRNASWPDRVRLLAHELVHSTQYALGGGIRGTSEQWLREGFAEAVAIDTVDRLGLGRASGLRRELLSPLGQLPVSEPPAPLADLATFPQWGKAQTRYRIPLYAQAFAAAELLIERHGHAAVVDYFARFRAAQAREMNFREAFGVSLEAFERQFQARWRQLVAQAR